MNIYQNAIEARLAVALENNCSASNQKKMRKLSAMLSSSELASMLEDAKINAERFTRAIYACEKVVKFAAQAVRRDVSTLNENTYAIFRTAINCYRHGVALTQTMIEASISRDVEIAKEVKHLVYRRSLIQTPETVAAQSQTSRDALVTLRILEPKADMKNSYSVKMTKLVRALCKAFELEVGKAR